VTTPRIRSLVSLAVALTVTLASGACVSASSHHASDAPAPTDGTLLAIRFDNEAREYVRVYLIGERREWLLGRVEPGARATLRIPEEALAGNPATMSLVVLAGDHATLQAARDARAATTVAQPVAAILSQRWTFSQALTNGQITALPLGDGRAEVGRP